MCKEPVRHKQGTQTTNSDKIISGLSFHRRSFRYFMAVIPVSLLLLISTSYQENPDEKNQNEPGYYSPKTIDSLRSYLASTPGDSQAIIHGTTTVMFQSVRSFYYRNGYKPVWIHYNGLSGRATSLLYLIEHAREFGLEPDNYHLSEIRDMHWQTNQKSGKNKLPGINIELEVLLTDAAFGFMVNLHAGYCSFDSALYASGWIDGLTDILLHGVATGELTANILSVEPRFIEYTRLRGASERFVRTNALTDQWVDIDYPTKDSLTLRSQVSEALNRLGYLDKRSITRDFNNALREFQHYHGLEPDGKLGKNTVEALKQSTLYKYRILALNLDRLRKKQDLDSNMLYVNIPAYTLKVFRGNAVKDTFRVIVGHPSTPTPMLAGNMQRIIANPVWFVPKTITIREILPKIKTDTGYLKRNGFKILDRQFKTVNSESLNLADISESNFDYTIRQDRGSDNSLGQIKFVFSNPYAVYLHDTPGKTLFSKDLRAFSHGCVRVQHPERLAGYIIQEINADTTNISRLITAGRHREFAVSSSLSVHITYITCEADEAGRIHFYKDIYGKDKKELDQLASFMDM